MRVACGPNQYFMMKKIILLALMAAACSPVIAQKKAANTPGVQLARETYKSLPIGAKIPLAEKMLNSADGRPVSLQQAQQDKGLLVMFSCNTCPYVIKAQQHTIDAMNQTKDMHIGMVIINSNEAMRDGGDAPHRMKEYADGQHYTVPYLVDEQSELANAFGATRTPEVFLFDGKGKLVYKGAIEDNPSEPQKTKEYYLLNAMHAVADGKPVKIAETKSIGCGIKRMSM